MLNFIGLNSTTDAEFNRSGPAISYKISAKKTIGILINRKETIMNGMLGVEQILRHSHPKPLIKCCNSLQVSSFPRILMKFG